MSYTSAFRGNNIDSILSTSAATGWVEELVLEAKRATLDAAYPVGSVYISFSATDPGNLFGGTWERIFGRFLYGITDDLTVGEVHGSWKHSHSIAGHSHQYGLQYAGFYGETILEGGTNVGLLNYANDNSFTFTGGNGIGSQGAVDINGNSSTTSTSTTFTPAHYRLIANASYTSLTTSEEYHAPPHIYVYMWKRIA